MKHLPQIGLALVCLTLLGQAPPPAPTGGVVQGRVETFFSGKPYEIDELWVYIERTTTGPLGEPGKGLTKNVPQKAKQFSPRVLVIPVGATVYFPNQEEDEEHSVFSPAFDTWFGFELHRIAAKQKGPPKQFKELGEFDIYCDLHPNMSAKVKVVPTQAFVKVTGGAYKLERVPPGTYRLVAWAPNSLEVRSVSFTIKAGDVIDIETLNLQYKKPPKSHVKSDGTPYTTGSGIYP